VEATAKKREKHYRDWCAFVAPLGVDPTLQTASYIHKMRCLSGFAAIQRAGVYGRGKQVQAGTVSGALTAVGQKIALDYEINPTKRLGSDKFAPRLAEMLTGWAKDDPATVKKMPVEADVPEFMAEQGYRKGGSQLSRAVGDCALIAFYFLLRVGEYTIKRSRNETKQTKQFKLEDCTFFRKNALGQLRQLPRAAPDKDIMSADSATLKLDNSKNGWKGVCINQEVNGETHNCAVRAIGRRYCYIREHGNQKTFLSAYWNDNGERMDVNDEDMRASIKWAAKELDYFGNKGIPDAQVDTHSLRIGGANALSLSGYSDRQITKKMKQKFNFVNVCAGAYSDVPVDITSTMVVTDYDSDESV
jgi:hypothetical protein